MGKRPAILRGDPQLTDAEHDHRKAGHAVRPPEQQARGVGHVEVANLSAKVVAGVGQPVQEGGQ